MIESKPARRRLYSLLRKVDARKDTTKKGGEKRDRQVFDEIPCRSSMMMYALNMMMMMRRSPFDDGASSALGTAIAIIMIVNKTKSK